MGTKPKQNARRKIFKIRFELYACGRKDTGKPGK
jgi:hypothetical protein